MRAFGERDTAILQDALVENLPHAEVATKHGISRGRVVQIVSPANVKEKLASVGGTEDQLRTLLGSLSAQTRAASLTNDQIAQAGNQAVVDRDLEGAGLAIVNSQGGSQGNVLDRTEKGVKLKTKEVAAKLQGLREQLSLAEKSDDLDTAEKVQKEINALEAEYVSPEERIAGKTQLVYEQAQAADELEAKITEAEQAGQTTVALKNAKVSLDEARGMVEELRIKVNDELNKTAALLSALKAAPSEVKPEVAAAQATAAEARKRWNDAGRDLTKLDTSDLQVLRTYTQSIKNLELSGKIAAELQSRGETVGATNAVSEPSATSVPVQEQPKGGGEVRQGNAQGGQTTTARKTKAAPAETQVKSSEEQWNDLAKTFPQMPAYETLSADEKTRWADVAQRGVANLAAANTILSAAVKATPAEKVATLAATGTTEKVEGVTIPKFGVDSVAKNPYTAAELTKDIKEFIRADILGNKLIIVDNLQALLESPLQDLKALATAIGDKGAYGVAVDGKAYLIANRIEKGDGRAKFMHEVGGHLGLENLLPKVLFNKLTSQLDAWAKADNGSVESKLAKAAQARVEAANTPAADRQSEMLAYFIEEAVQAGIDPTAAGKESAALQSWFRTLWAAFKVAIRRLGFKTEAVTAQDIVNLAFGAARLEITGTWHGTAADFRKFNHAFMSSGEGAQAFGWGTYLAQRVGVAKGYFVDDVKRKTTSRKFKTDSETLKKADAWLRKEAKTDGSPTTINQAEQWANWIGKTLPDWAYANGGKPEGSLMRVDTSVSDSEMIDWDAPVADQPELVKEFLADFLTEETTASAKQIKTGGDIYKYLLAKFYKEAGNTGKWDYAEKQTKLEIKKEVSQFLDDVGIKGHKFLDQLSRNVNNDPTLTFDGKVYTHSELRTMYKAGEDNLAAAKYILLRHILRNGVANVRAELEQKVAKTTAMYKQIRDESAARYNVKVDQAKDNERIKQDVSKTYEGQQLAWLDANESKIVVNETPRTRNVVIYNDKNIFRVGTEVAADIQRMKFGVNTPPTPSFVQQAISALPKVLQQPVRNSVGAIKDVTGKYLDYAVFTGDLVNRAVAAGLPSAKDFVQTIALSKAKAREAEQAVEKIADMYALVPDKDRGTGPASVNQFLFDSTRESKWGYGKYRNDVMGPRFDKLSKEAQDFVKAVFDHGATVLAQKKKVVLDSAVTEYDAMIKAAQDAGDLVVKAKLESEKAATLKRFQTLFKIREGLPYAPIKRTGDHAVVAKSTEYIQAELAKNTKRIKELESDPDHYHVSFTDGKWDARTLQSQLQDQGFFQDVQILERDDAVNSLYGGASALRELASMRSRVEAAAAAGDKSSSKLLGVISQMYLEALAENSARKSEMRRRGVAGEVDMVQSFAQQGRADAQFMASVQYNPQVQDSLQKMRNDAKTGNRERKSEIFNELSRRYIQSMEYYQNPWINKLTRVSSLYFLATSPAYYLQNLTQPWIMTVPSMAGRHGYTEASGALFKAYTELGGVMKGSKLLKQQFDFSKVPADVRDAIKELVNRGKIDIGLDSEIGEFRVEGEGYVREKLNSVDKAMRLAVQKVESINRLSSGIAAYRLELAKTNDKTKALDYADQILTDTHGDYTAFNAPRAFNNPVGKVMLQFRKFQLIQLAFHAKLIKDALQGRERAAALKALTYSLGHTAALAGVMGLPGYAAIAWAISKVLSGDDDKYDVEEEIRKAIGDEGTSNLVLRGAPTIAGMDISGKVGAGNMLSVLPFSNADVTTKAGLAQTFGTLVGGASLGMVANQVDGLGLMMAGDWYKGLERMMPKGVGDAMKAYRISNEGMTRRNGDVVLPAEEVTGVDTLLQAIGISPIEQARVYERQQVIRDQDQRFKDRAQRITQDYVRAMREGDSENAAKAREAWMNLQQVRMEKGYTRQPLSTLLKAPQAQRQREKDTAGGVQFTKANKRAVMEEAEL